MQSQFDHMARYSDFKDRLPACGGFGVVLLDIGRGLASRGGACPIALDLLSWGGNESSEEARLGSLTWELSVG
jgi:hypothetical protein